MSFRRGKFKNLMRLGAPLAALTLVPACGGDDDPGESAAEADAADEPTDEGDSTGEAEELTEFPHDSLTFVVPFGPGGGTDTLARLIVEYVEDELGVPVIVENVPGAGATIGTAQIYQAEPDGSVVGIPADNALALAPRVQEDIPYSDYDDFTYIIKAPANPMVMVTGADQPYQDLNDALEAARERPGELAIAHAGAFTTPDVTSEKLHAAADVQFNLVPHADGGSAARTSVISGRAEFGIAGASAYAGQIEAGELRALAVFWPERIELLPDAPTATEQGVDLEEAASSFYIVGPPDMDEAVRQLLIDAFSAAVTNPEFQERALEQGNQPLEIFGDDAEADIAAGIPLLEEIVPRFEARDQG
ncbi:MAG: tripartite tricarboxylate transporter substrate binding protein [Chloroflexota bacterium]